MKIYYSLFRGLLAPGQGGCGTRNLKALRLNIKNVCFQFFDAK